MKCKHVREENWNTFIKWCARWHVVSSIILEEVANPLRGMNLHSLKIGRCPTWNENRQVWRDYHKKIKERVSCEQETPTIEYWYVLFIAYSRKICSKAFISHISSKTSPPIDYLLFMIFYALVGETFDNIKHSQRKVIETRNLYRTW